MTSGAVGYIAFEEQLREQPRRGLGTQAEAPAVDEVLRDHRHDGADIYAALVLSEVGLEAVGHHRPSHVEPEVAKGLRCHLFGHVFQVAFA